MAKVEPRYPVMVGRVEGRFCPVPEMQFTIPMEAPRAGAAVLFRAAAAIEELSEGEFWTTEVEVGASRISLELSEGTEAEASRAVAVLRKVAKAFAKEVRRG